MKNTDIDIFLLWNYDDEWCIDAVLDEIG